MLFSNFRSWFRKSSKRSQQWTWAKANLTVELLEDRVAPVIGSITNAPAVARGLMYDGVARLSNFPFRLCLPTRNLSRPT